MREETFLSAWRAHIDELVTYAKAAKAGGADGAKMKKQALTHLKAFTNQQGRFFNTITKNKLPAAAVTESFETHIATLTAANDSFAAGKANAYDKVNTAAGHMPMTAMAVAGGVDAATNMAGDPDDAAATTHTRLTHDLVEHVYLSSLAVFTAYTSDGATDSDLFKAAAAALDDNSVALADTVAAVIDKTNGATFFTTWREHVSDVITYAEGVAGDDLDTREQALTDLENYRQSTGEFFATLSVRVQ